MSLWNWSKIFSSNATADPTINFSEGMAPSSVNDSSRAVMGQLARWRDDISGSLATTGTSSAYVLTTNEGDIGSPPTDGQMLSFTPNATNAVGVTLAVDGGTAYAIQTSPAVGVGAGVLVSGTPYVVKFSLANTAWMLRGFTGNPYNIPLGGLMPSTVDTPPNSNFVLPYGQAISRTTYAAYFAAVGTRFGVGDGVNTFNVPDMRGRGMLFLDNMGGSAASRLTSATMSPNGTTVGAVGGQQNFTVAQTNMTSFTFTISGSVTGSGATADSFSNELGTLATPGSGKSFWYNAGSSQSVALSLDSSGLSVPSGGSSTPIVNLAPSMALTVFLRIF